MSAPRNVFVRYLRRAGAGSLMISIAVHLVLLVAATAWVVTTVQEQRKTAFQGGGGNAPAAERKLVEHRVQMSRQQSSLSAVTQRLAVDSPNASVSLPDLPDMPGFSGAGPSLSGSLGGAGGDGGGLGSPKLSRGPLMPAFGFREAQPGGTLVGTFYDFKQLRTRKPNPDYKGDPNKHLDWPTGHFSNGEVKRFVDGNWSRSLLFKYYQAPTPLYATQIFIPNSPAAEAPKAYGVEKDVKPKGWMALYRGRVSPPKTGAYRFVGGGDDLLLVRLDGRLVLDGSIGKVSDFKTDRPEKPHYAGVPGTAVPKLVVGKRMELRAGLFYDINILISEAPGGELAAFLLFEQEGVDYAKKGNGDPILPIFRVADTPAQFEGQYAQFMKDGPVWRALPAPKD